MGNYLSLIKRSKNFLCQEQKTMVLSRALENVVLNCKLGLGEKVNPM